MALQEAGQPVDLFNWLDNMMEEDGTGVDFLGGAPAPAGRPGEAPPGEGSAIVFRHNRNHTCWCIHHARANLVWSRVR